MNNSETMSNQILELERLLMIYSNDAKHIRRTAVRFLFNDDAKFDLVIKGLYPVNKLSTNERILFFHFD